MLPEQFTSQYPLTSEAFARMVRRDLSDSGKPSDTNAIKAELQKHPLSEGLADELFAAAWAEMQASRADFLTCTGDGFRYFGVNDEVRAFIGGLWAAAFRRWSPAEQADFLRLLLAHEQVRRELALEFLPKAAHELDLAPADLLAWLNDARRGPDGANYPNRIPAVLKVYAETKPLDGLQLAELLLRQSLDDTNARVIALVLHWVRERAGGELAVRLALDPIEMALSTGNPGHRSIRLESWAFSASSAALDEAMARSLKQELVRGSPAEIKAWCFLLNQVVATSPAKWRWCYDELCLLARPTLAPDHKFLVATAALDGWLRTAPTSAVTRNEWESLIRMLTPFGAGDGGLWHHLEHFLVDAFQQDAAAAPMLVRLIAETSGKAWVKMLEENHDQFAWLCQILRHTGHAEGVVTALCFSDIRSARRVGLFLFARSGLVGFSPSAVAQADAWQIERLLLENVLKIGEYDHLAQLHVTFADRVDQLGGALADWFYDEALTQALNTHQYRETILAHAGARAKLRAIVAEAERRIEVSAKASQSPALRMRIPGHARAEVITMRRFGREVAKGVAKYSVLAQLVTTVPLLYGKSWRMQNSSGGLSATSTLNKSEVTTEMPRLEFMTPEAMRRRRLLAVHRIAELDQHVEEDEV